MQRRPCTVLSLTLPASLAACRHGSSPRAGASSAAREKPATAAAGASSPTSSPARDAREHTVDPIVLAWLHDNPNPSTGEIDDALPNETFRLTALREDG